MRKRLIKWVALISIPFGILFACKEYDEQGYPQKEPKLDRATEIANARTWYESQAAVRSRTRASSKEDSPQGTLLNMEPNWKLTYRRKNDRYRTVESVMTSNERVTFLSPELINKLEQDRDYRFKKSITRLIVRTDRETQEVVGFTMTIIPSIEYLELTAFNPFHNTYVNRDEHFGGYIIYHNLDGTFANGWKYVDGKITHTVSESIVPVDSIKNSPSVQTRMHEECEEFVYEVLVEECFEWCTETEWGTTCEIDHCDYYTEIRDSWEECDWVEDEDDYGGGGYIPKPKPDPDPKPEKTKDPCETAKKTSSNQGLKDRVNAIFDQTFPYRVGATEHGYIRTTSGEMIYPTTLTATSLQYSTKDVANKSYSEWYHSHPTGVPITSLSDLKALSEAYLKGRIKSDNFTYGVMASNGCTIISIKSETNFKTFATNMQNGAYDVLFDRLVQHGKKGDFDQSLENLLLFFDRISAGLSMLFRPMNDWETGKHQGNWTPKELDENNKMTNSNCN